MITVYQFVDITYALAFICRCITITNPNDPRFVKDMIELLNRHVYEIDCYNNEYEDMECTPDEQREEHEN